jgi:hypothetical protein
MKALLTLALALLLAGCAAGQGSAGRSIAEETTAHKEETTALQGGGDLRRPPESTLSYGGREVSGRLGTYCWSYGNGSVCADAWAPQVPRKEQTLTVPSGSEMVFRYGGQRSPKMVTIDVYPLDKKGTSTASADSDLSGSLKVHGSGVERTIPVELPPGEYVVDVFVIEQQGDASYSFRVMVE